MKNNMNITDTEVAGLHRSMKSAGLPKSINGVYEKPNSINALGKAPPGSGHDCFLKGITVSAVIEADHSWWMQWMRYHFQDIVSSTSKMHTILQGDAVFEKGTDIEIIKRWTELKEDCIVNTSLEKFQSLIMSTPIGLMLTADTRTNYLQLKTVYKQRRTHKMKAWQLYCDWIENLPDFLALIN